MTQKSNETRKNFSKKVKTSSKMGWIDESRGPYPYQKHVV